MRLKFEIRRERKTLDFLKTSIVSIIAAIIVFGIFLVSQGINPLIAYGELFHFAFVSKNGLNLTILYSGSFLLLTLAFILPKKAGIWNIGAQGQFFVGAIFATGIFALCGYQPTTTTIILMLFGAILGGAGWAFIPGYLKGKFNVNEIVVTLMLNFVAILFVAFLVAGGPWSGAGRPESFPITVKIPNIKIGALEIPPILLVGIVLAVFISFLLKRTRLGFEIRASGSNPVTSERAGISLIKVILITMVIGGMLAGIAGFQQVTYLGKLRMDISPSWGYYAIVFGLLANVSSLAAIIVSPFLTGLFFTGRHVFIVKLGMTAGAEDIFIGIFMIILVAFQFLQFYKIRWTRGTG